MISNTIIDSKGEKMAQILVRNLSERTHGALRRQAVEHHKSLEAEVRSILEAATQPSDEFALPTMLAPKRKGGKTLAQLVSEGRR
jgi:plasmid stability protein